MTLQPGKQQKRMKRIGFNIGRFGVYGYAHAYPYFSIIVIPTIQIDAVKGHDYYLDFGIRFLIFSIAIRFIWLRRKR